MTILGNSSQWSFVPTGPSDEVVLEGESACGRAGGDIELYEDVAHVTGGGPLAYHQFRCDLSIRFAPRDECQYLDLPWRQPAGELWGWGAGELMRKRRASTSNVPPVNSSVSLWSASICTNRFVPGDDVV